MHARTRRPCAPAGSLDAHTGQAELARTDTPKGLRLRFRADPAVAHELRTLAATENECCSWAAWSVEEAGAVVVLAVRAQGEAVAAARALFD